MQTRSLLIVVLLALVSIASGSPVAAENLEDPWQWLEQVEDEKALAWVEERNRESASEIEAVPEFEEIRATNLRIYNSSERIPYISIRGDKLYNFWQDADHTRGIWRRTTLAEYRKDQPKWETVLDIDALADSEDENWVYKGPWSSATRVSMRAESMR